MSVSTERAVLAGGCFWGVQDLIRRYPGVISTRVGYSGGDVKNATYRNHGTHAEALEIIFDLVKHEGLCMGGSTGINVAGAIRLAREIGPGKTIVTLLCDHGSRYQSKIFNPAFLRERDLPLPQWLLQGARA